MTAAPREHGSVPEYGAALGDPAALPEHVVGLPEHVVGLPEHVDEFRARHRARHIGPRYNGWLHFSTTTVGSLTAIAIALWQVDSPSLLELLSVPLFFLIANLGEYAGHRGPMHHLTRRLAVLFERHTQQHHRYYTHDAMAAESPKDFQMVLFPPVMLVFFLGGLATPIGLVIGLLATPNLGWLFAATGVSYFLLYEWLHWSYHQPASSWIGRRRVIRHLRRHHTIHHDVRRMTTVNFNITFPIADRLFGTMARADHATANEPAIANEHTRVAHR